MLKRILLVVGGVLYALLFGELFLRLLNPQPLVPRYVTGSPEGIRANMPNVAFRQWTPEVDVTVRYNAAGMRDDRPPPPLAKQPGECRVALLGDSFFVGFESDFAHSFPKRLEDALAARGRRCRVLDFAVSGFGTAEMLVAMQARVARWHPDYVVMSWHATDPVDNIRSDLFAVDADGRLVRRSPTFLPGIEASDALMRTPGYRWLIENSHLYSAVRETLGALTKGLLAQARAAALRKPAQAEIEDEGAPPPLPGQARPGSPALDQALIFAVRDAAKAAGATLVLVDIPIRHTRTDFISVFDWLPPEVFDGVVTVDPIGALRAAARPDRPMYLERGQRHWTAAGNAVAAGVVADRIAGLSRGG